MRILQNSNIFLLFSLSLISLFNTSLAIDCYECKSDVKSCTIDPDSLESKKCEDDKKGCITKIVGDEGLTERSCVVEDECKNVAKENCTFCTETGKKPCNNVILLNDKRPKCHVCEGTECFDVDKKNPQHCQHIKDKAEDHCFTIDEGSTITRGCLADIEDKCDKDKCVKCKNNKLDEACNNKKKENQEFSCYKCRSDSEPDCIKPNKKIIKVETCKTEKKCYAEINIEKNTIYRACAEILSEAEHETCKSETCKLCDTSECNSMELKNSASSKTVSIFFATLLSLTSLKYFN